MSGYLHFDQTGNAAIDAISAEIENAGDAYHHTSEWSEAPWRDDKKSYIDAIQDSLNKAALEAAKDKTEIVALRLLLVRIREWDMMNVAADGLFWLREIDAALGK